MDRKKGCNGCEPDVRITIQFADGTKSIIFVEAKYLSGKSSEASDQREAPYDQLAREWDNLQEISADEGATPILLYVTSDLSYPMKDFLDSKQDYMHQRKKEMRMFWISWRKLPKLFSNRKKDSLKRDILSDLVDVLKLLRLTFFEGIKIPDPIDIKWAFQVNERWDWASYKEYEINWKYDDRKNYNWKYETELLEWRFKK